MKNLDDIMKEYVSSFSGNKEKDLEKLCSVSAPPKSYSYIIKAACILLSVCTVLFIILFTQGTRGTQNTQKTLALSDVYSDPIKGKNPTSSSGNLEIMDSQKYDVESYMYDERFSEFTKDILTPKLKKHSAKVDVLLNEGNQVGVRVRVDNFLILPGVTAVDAYYIDKDYQISDFEEFTKLTSSAEYSDYEVFYEIKDSNCLLFFGSDEVCCYASVELKSLNNNKNWEITKILNIIFK